MIDPFHLEAYGETTVNYNRDVEIFPVLNTIFEKIYGESPYKSPTDMGVNMAGNCICDDEVCREASCQEIIRRYYAALNELVKGRHFGQGSAEDRAAHEYGRNYNRRPQSSRRSAETRKRDRRTGSCLELEDGRIVTGKTTNLLGASAALLLNVLKDLAGIDHEQHIISPESIEPIQKLKVDYLKSKNPRLHTDEVLIALSASAADSPEARLALSQLPKLDGCQAHTSVMLSDVDIKIFKKLGVQLTCEAVFEHILVFRKKMLYFLYFHGVYYISIFFRQSDYMYGSCRNGAAFHPWSDCTLFSGTVLPFTRYFQSQEGIYYGSKICICYRRCCIRSRQRDNGRISRASV